ncbi:MAG: hypothetical protein HY000_08770 [Planctomycetes bacterium]|nr:hypothetical protein [Planctomycetota bacterium]
MILKKMQYFQVGGSEKHLRDIVGVLLVQGEHVDRDYILQWANRLGVAEIWSTVQSRLAQQN